MRKKYYGAMTLPLYLFLLSTLYRPVCSQMWWEETTEQYRYDLSQFRFLIVLGDDFDYQETRVVKDHWEKWGATVDIAGTGTNITGHLWKKTETGWDRSEKRQLQTDVLLSHINLSQYQVLFFPGGKSPTHLFKEDSSHIVQLVQEADRRGLVLAAICHGPQVLAASKVIHDRKVTGHREIVQQLTDAGGLFVNEVCVADGHIVTGNWPYFGSMAATVAERLLYPDGGGPSEHSPFETNPVLKAIRERRSIRKFEDRDVEPDLIEILLRAATWAPSANNDQPWKCIVLRENTIKQQIVDSLIGTMKEYYEEKGIPVERIQAYWSSVFSAPVHIFAFCDTRNVTMDEEWEEIEILHNIQGVSAACQNILLAATALHLGSLWMGGPLVVEDDIQTLLYVPDGVKLVAIIAIGYPAHEPLPPVRRPLSAIVGYGRWEGN